MVVFVELNTIIPIDSDLKLFDTTLENIVKSAVQLIAEDTDI